MPSINVIYQGPLDDAALRERATVEKREGGVDGYRRFTLVLPEEIVKNRDRLEHALAELNMREDAYVGDEAFEKAAPAIARATTSLSQGDDVW